MCFIVVITLFLNNLLTCAMFFSSAMSVFTCPNDMYIYIYVYICMYAHRKTYMCIIETLQSKLVLNAFWTNASPCHDIL